jgi:hypothetical protein
MNQIDTEIIINAPKEIIWSVLTDFSAYPQWNPFIVRLWGTAQADKPILFVARINGLSIPIIASILSFDVNAKLSWGAPRNAWFKPIVNPEHFCIIEEISATKCKLVHGESMGGFVPRALWPVIKRSRPAYVAMNQALKKRCELNFNIVNQASPA